MRVLIVDDEPLSSREPTKSGSQQCAGSNRCVLTSRRDETAGMKRDWQKTGYEVTSDDSANP